MKDFVFLGMPGAGKGTQAQIADEAHPDYSHISTGDIFRALMSQENAIGLYAKQRIDQGRLVEDNVTISLFDAYFFTVLNQEKYMLLDGYPRTIPQLYDLIRLSTEHNRSLVGIYFTVPDEVAIERILGRARPGETKEVIAKRLEEFHQHTKPILDAFEKHAPLHEIDATQSIQQVAEKVEKLMVSA